MFGIPAFSAVNIVIIVDSLILVTTILTIIFMRMIIIITTIVAFYLINCHFDNYDSQCYFSISNVSCYSFVGFFSY
jgi:hypothetical protein